MSCDCGTAGSICIPRGDDMSILFSVYDNDGAEFDISGAIEIIFIVATGVVIGGNIGPGGTVLITKKLSLGDITIAGTLYQFVVDIVSADTDGFTQTNNYYEANIETSGGVNKTVSCGLFKSQNTMIKDLI